MTRSLSSEDEVVNSSEGDVAKAEDFSSGGLTARNVKSSALCSFLASSGRSRGFGVSLVGQSESERQRKGGPAHQSGCLANSVGDAPLDKTSAGFRSVGTQCHLEGTDLLRILSTLLWT